MSVTQADLSAALRRVRPHTHRTPVLTSSQLDARVSARLFFKCENFQRTGSFKMRGATNALGVLCEQGAPEAVVTHSSGNFAQALALAARLHGLRATIVMPRNAPAVKRDAVLGYGAEVIPCEPTLPDRERTAQRVVEETGATLVHSYNDLPVIAGQGTAAMELVEEVADLDVLVAPVGGGGLISGTSLAARYFGRDTEVIGGEPEGADDAFRSVEAGHIIPSESPRTIADGLRTSLGTNTFAIIRRHVAAIIRISETEIVQALELVYTRLKIVIEPSSAVAVAAVLKEKKRMRGRRVGIILSGGNVDLAGWPLLTGGSEK